MQIINRVIAIYINKLWETYMPEAILNMEWYMCNVLSVIYINTTRGVLWHLGTIRKSVAWARNFRPHPPLSTPTFPKISPLTKSSLPTIFPHNFPTSSPTFFPRDHRGGLIFLSFSQKLTILFVLVCVYNFLPFIVLPKISQKLYISF